MSQEERNEIVSKVRAENQRTADRVEQGTTYHESVTVFFTDRKEHTVEVHPLSSKQFREAARKANLNIGDLMEEKQGKDGNVTREVKLDKIMLCLDMLGYMAEFATCDPTITDRLLTVDEEGKIALKAIELMSPPKN